MGNVWKTYDDLDQLSDFKVGERYRIVIGQKERDIINSIPNTNDKFVEEILKINGKTVEILDADPNRITIKGNDHGISDWKISEPHWFIFRRPISEHFEDNLFSV